VRRRLNALSRQAGFGVPVMGVAVRVFVRQR
jgi:hypothetical protein